MKFNTQLDWLTLPPFTKSRVSFACADFKGLNNICPKDVSITIANFFMDATKGFRALSFMDGFLGYCQFKMDLRDEELTIFSIT